MKSTRWLWLMGAIVVVAALALVRARRVQERNAAPKVASPPVAVALAPVSRGAVAAQRHVLGTVVGADEAEVAPRIMAAILEVPVREGDTVHRGQLLVRLDPRELEDAVAQARAGLAAARQSLVAAEVARQTQVDATGRDSVLFAAKAIATEQWDRSRSARAAALARRQAARSQVAVARRRLDQVETRLSYARLTAPFDGVVAARHADPGDLAIPGRPLVDVVRQGAVRVRAAVPPEDLPYLAVGQSATLTLGDASVVAPVSRVFPALGRSHLARVEIDLDTPPPGFVSGATVGADLTLASDQGLRVPADALLEGERGSFVFVAAADTLRAIPVQVGVRGPEQVTVGGELQPGDRVVVARPSRLMALATGVRVRPATAPTPHPASR